jgi:hypothetical protein
MAESPPASQIPHLLLHYSFDLNGYLVPQLVKAWSSQYSEEWIVMAIVEALYQGRYKAVSVEQILALWQRRGQPNHHFTSEFERLVCDRVPRNLTGLPHTALPTPTLPQRATAQRTTAQRATTQRSNAQRSNTPSPNAQRTPTAQRPNAQRSQLSLPEVPDSPLRRLNQNGYGTASGLGPTPQPTGPAPDLPVPPSPASTNEASGRSHRFFNHLAGLINQGEDAATSGEAPSSDQSPLQDRIDSLKREVRTGDRSQAAAPLAQQPYDPNWLSNQEPIENFVPPTPNSEFHDRLRSVVKPDEEEG